uniref:Smr domain-containing protein n=1 Tax=Heterorhabditis bacteriophora TaxID=37862 RepID=A0A1I7WDI9_HETBA
MVLADCSELIRVSAGKRQMPRHLISDAHEWINEIPTRNHSQGNGLGKNNPVELDSIMRGV